ncbi:MAG: MarR family transcriptional regulator [Alphaproteobacteria bacterium]|nr:MarR family transcriptional regulator [Alphaproteobacteria bacterium]
MSHPPERVAAVVEAGLLVTRAYFPLRALSEQVLRPVGSSTARMAMLRTLAHHGPLTVPDIARMRPVARQGVQRIANEMVRDGYLCWVENPQHKRSRLLALTKEGVARYQELEALQLQWAERLAARLDPEAVRDASRALRALRAAFLEALEEAEGG